MSVNTKYFSKLHIPKDGNCLFRSLVIFLNEHLLRCRRNRSGLPTNMNYTEYEASCTDFLRKSVVRMIRARKSRYSNPEFYDNERYTSIDDRIEKMTKQGEFGGKLEMDILSKMYKINIHVFIPFNDEYSCIYKSNSDTSAINLQSVFDRQDADTDYDNDYEYSEGKYCFLLLDENNYSILEPNYAEIKNDFPQPEPSGSSDANMTLTITDKRLSKQHSSSELSDTSILNNSHDTSISLNFDDDGFEKIDTNDDITQTHVGDDTYYSKFLTFLNSGKNAILVHSDSGSKFIELRENYKTLAFNDLIDIINSIEESSLKSIGKN
jgi:hypothetical protein